MLLWYSSLPTLMRNHVVWFVISDQEVKGVGHQSLSSIIAVIQLFSFCSSLHPILHFCFHYSSIIKLDVFQDVLWVVNFSQEGLFDVSFFFFPARSSRVALGFDLRRTTAECGRQMSGEQSWHVISGIHRGIQYVRRRSPWMTESKQDDQTHNARILSKMFEFSSPSRKGNDS